ncbi:MAG: dihydrodipicolinate synthase family protein [Lentisphaerae bacterium RIFOXYB12_FULL_65_16]|nr:MAG: dihydrodipicolinate synthase family protein [Lentisphaerae bacterium RIFOXYA12_64_32]OGV88769.1 MAG: dihydrodipicolinate synthase family protein [Lentisphaerae bacterium RIFOXYB12_FULL_65_16]
MSTTTETRAPRFAGVIPPLVTPLLERDTLDAAGLERLVEHVLGGGVSGLFVLGTSGEAPCLSYRLRRELVERVCRQVAGRVPVLVGITDTAFPESVSLARHAADHGATALVLAPPYYMPPGQAEFLEYLGDLLPELPLPLVLYNMPAMTKVHLDPDTVRKAAELPGVVGIKDSSGNMVYFHDLLRFAAERRDFSVLMGPEELLGEAVLFGAHGGIPGGANIAPQLYVRMVEAGRNRDAATVIELQAQILKLREIYRIGRYASNVIKGIKCALNLLGLCSDTMAEPFHSFHAPERERTRAVLCDLGLIKA